MATASYKTYEAETKPSHASSRIFALSPFMLRTVNSQRSQCRIVFRQSEIQKVEMVGVAISGNTSSPPVLAAFSLVQNGKLVAESGENRYTTLTEGFDQAKRCADMFMAVALH